MRKIIAPIGLMAAALALGGCQAIFGGGNGSRADAADIDMGDYFAVRIAAGRAHLEADRPSKAVVAFRQASYDPRFAGEAFNGMAIAYDRMGRPDLAARYFERAMAAAPDDARFSRNLARLQNRTPLAPEERMARPELGVDEALIAQASQVAPINVPEPAPVVLQTPSTQLVAGPQGTVRITRSAEAVPGLAAEATPQPMRQARREAVINVERRIAAQNRVRSIRRNAQARKAYPIRVVLRDRQDARYPIRIDLSERDD